VRSRNKPLYTWASLHGGVEWLIARSHEPTPRHPVRPAPPLGGESFSIMHFDCFWISSMLLDLKHAFSLMHFDCF